MATKLSHAPIEGKLVRLRLLSAADIEMTRCWRNQDHIRKWFATADIIEAHQQRAWFEKYQTKEDDYIYVVEAKQAIGWKPVGQISLYAIDREKRCAEYGRILVGEKEAAGKGFLFEASTLMIEYWHKEHQIEDFVLEVKTDNSRARHLYEKLGFVVEGQDEHNVKMRLLANLKSPFIETPLATGTR